VKAEMKIGCQKRLHGFGKSEPGRYTSIYSRVPNRFSFILVISNIPFETDMDDVYRATAERNLMVSSI
jgi:hypothetical protein